MAPPPHNTWHLLDVDPWTADPGATETELRPGVTIPSRFTRRFRQKDTGTVVTLSVLVEGGEPTVRRLEVAADEDNGRGVDRDRLRGIPVSELLRQALAVSAFVEDKERGQVMNNQTARRVAGRLRPPGREVPRDELEDVARVYLEHDGSTPTQAVAGVFHLSTSGAAKRVRKARQAGLIPPTTKGRASNRKGER